MKKYDVVQFNENHKWCGCIGFISEISTSKIMVGQEIWGITVGLETVHNGRI